MILMTLFPFLMLLVLNLLIVLRKSIDTAKQKKRKRERDRSRLLSRNPPLILSSMRINGPNRRAFSADAGNFRRRASTERLKSREPKAKSHDSTMVVVIPSREFDAKTGTVIEMETLKSTSAAAAAASSSFASSSSSSSSDDSITMIMVVVLFLFCNTLVYFFYWINLIFFLNFILF